jgi:hypothetical protein
VTIKQFKQVRHEEEVIASLEKWIVDVRSGKEKVRTAVLCWRDGDEETIGHLVCGAITATSSIMGMLYFVAHMLFGRTKRVN